MATEPTVNSMLVNDQSITFYDDDFRNVLEDHMTILRNSSNTVMISVTPQQAYQYEFDMTGLLLLLGIPVQLHWAVIRMNHLFSLTQVPADLMQLLIPGEQEVNRIKQICETVRKQTA